MDNKKNGFTLIEMMMAVALVSIIVGGLGQVIAMAAKAYTINLENTEAMTKIVPVVKRIEYDLMDTSGGAVSITAGSNSVSMTISSSAINNTYWWDRDGNGEQGTPEGALSTTNSTSIYMKRGINPADVLLISNGTIPAVLATKYGGTTWGNAAVKISNVNFTYLTTNASSGLTTVTTPAIGVNVDYVQINIQLTGARENTVFNYHTGFKVAR